MKKLKLILTFLLLAAPSFASNHAFIGGGLAVTSVKATSVSLPVFHDDYFTVACLPISNWLYPIVPDCPEGWARTTAAENACKAAFRTGVGLDRIVACNAETAADNARHAAILAANLAHSAAVDTAWNNYDSEIDFADDVFNWRHDAILAQLAAGTITQAQFDAYLAIFQQTLQDEYDAAETRRIAALALAAADLVTATNAAESAFASAMTSIYGTLTGKILGRFADYAACMAAACQEEI